LPPRFSRLVASTVTGAAKVTLAKSPLKMMLVICILDERPKDDL
jgi:hypothetical protein